MVHLGDITKISGRTAPVVDCVIGGSPCQDLSIAGRRAGLSGERSGLFMEQLRIVKEMREEDKQRGRTGILVRPRFMVWENVPGAFSSNGGRDFQAVLSEIIRVAEPDAPDVPLPPKGKWPLADAYYGDGWSVAYRVLDAQFWGVPQRRRRIALVADFGGHAAPEILFERESVSGDIAEVGAPGETAAGDLGAGAGVAVAVRMRAGCAGGGKGALVQIEKSGTLGCSNDQTIFCIEPVDKSCTLDRNGGAPTSQQGGVCIVQMTFPDGVAYALRAKGSLSQREDQDTLVLVAMPSGVTSFDLAQVTSKTNQSKGSVGVAYSLAKTGQPAVITTTEDGTVLLDGQPCVLVKLLVRRLTPLECERLQGYPDGWTDIGPWTDSKGKVHKESSDSARYMDLGNSIALPPWKWVMKRISAQYERDATMASLFDGIGGFPLLWEQINGKGSCLWASEIEEFPITVTRYHFGEEQDAMTGSKRRVAV